MNRKKLTQLFTLARNDAAPAAPQDFAENVLRAIRRDSPIAPGIGSLFDQVNALFPRIVLIASAMILLCVVLDYGLTAAGIPSLSDGAAQISAQRFMSPTGF